MKELLLRILDISKESYTQEVNRSSNLLTKSDYLIKYISATFVLINAIFVFLATNKVLNLFFLAGAYFGITIILCISLFLAVRAQVLKNALYFPTGNKVIDEIKSEWEKDKKENNEITLINRTINYYSDFVVKLEGVNNTRSSIINKAYGSYIGAIVLSSIIFSACLLLVA